MSFARLGSMGRGMGHLGALGGPSKSPVARMLSLANTRVIDFIGIGDSHELQNGNGYDDGIGRALAQNYGAWITPLYSQEVTGTSLSNSGFASSSPATLTNSATTGADAALDAYLLPSNHPYAYQATGDMGSTNGVSLLNDADGLDVNANLRAHFCYATFDSGTGSFRMAVRQGASPFSTLLTGSVIATNTGAFGEAIATLDLAAASRNIGLEFKWRMNGGTANVGPTLERWMRVENRDQTAGAAFSTLYGVGGSSLYDMAAYVIAESDTALTNYFKAIRYAQVQRGLDPIVIVRICSGHNDRSETSTPSLGPSPSNDPTSAAAYIDNLNAIVNRLRNIWDTVNGWTAANLAFLVTPSHPDSSDTLVATYRAAAKTWAAARTDATAFDYTTVTSYSEINSNSWFLSAPHLSLTGYETLAAREIAGIR